MSVVGPVCVRVDVSVLHTAWVHVGVGVEAPLLPTSQKTESERDDHHTERRLGAALDCVRQMRPEEDGRYAESHNRKTVPAAPGKAK